MEPQELHDRLAEQIGAHHSMLVAYSGGVDSTVLAVVAHEVLGECMLAVLAESELNPASETAAARCLTGELGLPLVEIHADSLGNPGVSQNPADRCYYCKDDLFSALDALARERGLSVVADGTNADDAADRRPGRRAGVEHGVVTPLADAGLTKAHVRELAHFLGLPNAEKPSMACLATRFPYDEPIDSERLARVTRAEDALRALGFAQFRVRAHGNLARVEISPEELEAGWSARSEIVTSLKAAGFAYVSLDLEGYRTGAMNEVLDPED